MKTKTETLLKTWDHASYLSDAEITLLFERVQEAHLALRILGLSHRTRRGFFELEHSMDQVMRARKLPVDQGPTFAEQDKMASEIADLLYQAKHTFDDAPRDSNLLQLADLLEGATETIRHVAEDELFAEYVGSRARILRSFADHHMPTQSGPAPR